MIVASKSQLLYISIVVLSLNPASFNFCDICSSALPSILSPNLYLFILFTIYLIIPILFKLAALSYIRYYTLPITNSPTVTL